MIRLLLLLFVSTAWAQDYVLVVPTSSKISGITELIAEATARPGELSYGSTGPASRLAGDLLVSMTKTRLIHAPYENENVAFRDLFDGKLSFMFAPVVAAAPQVDGGKLRAFAVIGPGRAGMLPKVPTMDEAGFRGFGKEFARLMRNSQ